MSLREQQLINTCMEMSSQHCGARLFPGRWSASRKCSAGRKNVSNAESCPKRVCPTLGHVRRWRQVECLSEVPCSKNSITDTFRPLLYHSVALSLVIQTSTNLEFERSSEPLHISAT